MANAPPGRRSPGAAISRATATSTQQADEANAHSVTARRQDGDDAPGLFDAVVERNAYGTETTFSIPPYVRGPGRRTTSGPQDAQAPAWWWAEAERIVVALVDAGHTVTSDTLHERFLDEPSATGAAFGGLFARLAAAGRIVEVGWAKSTRPAARGRRIVVWGQP